jgi:hypothetical protein
LGPHFHHFSFSTRILYGQYVQWLFRNEGSPLEPKLRFDGQVLCPTHTVYTLHRERYHCVFSPATDTTSLMVRGPAHFKPRQRCERTAVIVQEILDRRERLISAMKQLVDTAGNYVQLDSQITFVRARD